MQAVQQRQNQRMSQEQEFRESLQEAMALIRAVMPLCPTTQDLMEVLHLAMGSDAQVRMLISLIQSSGEE